MQFNKLHTTKKLWKIISLSLIALIVLLGLVYSGFHIIQGLQMQTPLNKVENKLKSDSNLIEYPDKHHPGNFVRCEVASNEPAVYSDITISFDDAYQKAVEFIEKYNLNESYPYVLVYPLSDELADEPRRNKIIPFALAEFDCLYNYWLLTFKIQAPEERRQELKLKFQYSIGVDDGGILFIALN